MKRPGKWEEKGVVIAGLPLRDARRGCIAGATVNYSSGGIGFVYRRGSMERIVISERPDSESMPDVDILHLDIDREGRRPDYLEPIVSRLFRR